MWDADLGRYVDPVYEQWAAEARARHRPVRQAAGGPGFWQGYWYYLWNPSKMDRDLRIAQKVALGTAAVAGGGAAGLAAGGAVTTGLVGTGMTAGKAAFAGGAVGSTVGSATGYVIGRPLGEDVAAVGALGGGLIGSFAPAAASAVSSAPAHVGRLVHLTNAEAGAGINSSGTLVGNNYAGPLSNAGSSGLGVTWRTGLSPSAYEVAVPIPRAAQGAFSPVRPIGPISGWQYVTGQQYTARGVLDLSTGAFTRQGVNWNQVLIYTFDAGFDATVVGGSIYVGSGLFGGRNEKK